MATKIKFFKGGFKYISQIFDEEKEEEIQIGLPTDVKHVAHIGGNAPCAEAPSWMKDFKSAPLAGPAEDTVDEKPDIQWVSEDTKAKRDQKATTKEGTESSGRGKSSDKKERSRHHRRHHSTSGASDSSDASARNLPDIPKKSRRKKSKEEGGGSKRSQARANAAAGGSGAETEPALPPLNPSSNRGEI